MIEFKRNVVIFTILTAGAVYVLYEDLRKTFMPVVQKVNLTTEDTEVYIGRKLLALDSNGTEDSLELKTEFNPFVEEKSNNDEEIKEISKSFVAYNKLGRIRTKRLSRRKRDARHNDFGWKLSLNVTNNKNHPQEALNLGSEDKSSSKPGKEKFLNMAVQMEGASPDDNYKELHQAWDSLGLLLRRLYGKNASFMENDRNITAEVSTELNGIETSDFRTEKPESERKPKFLFGLFNSGNSENPPFEGNGTVLENGNGSETVTSQKTSIVPMEGKTSTEVPSSPDVTEEPIEAFGLVEAFSEEPTEVPTPEAFMDFESTSSEINTQVEEKFAKSSAIPVEVTTIKPEPSFTSEQLKEFCISLLSRIHVSPKSVDHFSEEEGSGEINMMNLENKETMTGIQPDSTDIPEEATTKSTNQRFGIWASIWNRFAGRRLVQHPIDANQQLSITPKLDIILDETKDSDNGIISLKSESSTVKSISDSTEPNEDLFSDDDGSALNVPDCENFFRQIQHDAVFSKPNLLDIINNPILLSLDPSHFNFTEIRDDKQMRSMRSDSNITEVKGVTSSAKSTPKEFFDVFAVNELSSEQLDKNLFENTVSNQDPLSTPNSFVRSKEFDMSGIDNLIIENGKDLRKSATEAALTSDKFTTMEIQQFTGLLDDGLFVQSDAHARNFEPSEIPSSEVPADIDARIFRTPDFGSGERSLEDSDTRTDEMPSPEISTDKDERVFGILNFGSGERNLEDSDSLTTQHLSEFPENRSFHPDVMNSSISDSEFIEELSAKEQEITSTNSVPGLGIFDLVLNLRKEESQMSNTESENFAINETNPQTVSESLIPSERQRTELQFDPEEKTTKNQNALDLINIHATESILDNQTPLQNILDEKQHIEFRFDREEKFTESPNIAMDSKNMSETKLQSEDETTLQNVLNERNGDEGSRIFPALLDVFGSGDGRELLESTTDSKLNSAFTESSENKSSSFSVDDYDDCGSDINDTSMLIGGNLPTTINPLSNKIVSDASVHDDAVYINNIDTSNQEPFVFSTPHSLTVPETINYENYYNYDNPGYEATNYETYDNYANIGYEATNYENYDNSKNTGYDATNYEHNDNYDANVGYEQTNYGYHNSENYGYEVTHQPLEHVHIEGECDESHFDRKTEAFSVNPAVATTVPEDFRLIDTLFLTGSGAGGLFGNDDGEINFVQEPDTTSFNFQPSPVSPRQSRRGGRMDDSSFQTWPTEGKEQKPEKQPENASGIFGRNPQDQVLQPPEEEQGPISHLTTLGSIQTVEEIFGNPRINKDTTLPFQDVTNAPVTAISMATSSFVIPKKKANDLPLIYCNHAGECNITLNEGCITKKGHGVCDCRRSFVRHPETGICEAPFMMRTSLRLPGEAFHEDLRDKHSELYKNKTEAAIDTMWLVVFQDPTLDYNIADIDVTGFEEGSLVIHWMLTFAVKNVSVSEIVQKVDLGLEENLKNRKVIQLSPLNVENAKLMSSSDINSCEEKELNYCSKDADCLRDEDQGFRCQCKSGYLDNSKNPMYPGEICIAACPQDYCGENGYCEVKRNGEKQCLCNGWHFGEKCDISGILVVSCFAGANCVLIVLVLAAVFFCKRRRQRGTRFYESNQMMFQPRQEMRPFGQVSPRLASTIALNEMGPTKTSKYMSISTPLYMGPDIKITSPSIMGSSISYDYDSTFDRTPSAEVNMEPPKYDSVPEVPKYNPAPEV